MGAEQVDGVPEEGDGAGNAVAADAAGCIMRRFAIGPGRVIRDGSGNTIAFLMGTGGEALGAGSAGAKLALGVGRKLVGAETPEPPATETTEP